MPYIGNNIRSADDYRLIDDISSGFDGSTTSFAISPGHNHYSVLVFLNGVAQIPGVDYTVSGNAVDFSVGTIPATGSVIHIRELVI